MLEIRGIYQSCWKESRSGKSTPAIEPPPEKANYDSHSGSMQERVYQGKSLNNIGQRRQGAPLDL